MKSKVKKLLLILLVLFITLSPKTRITIANSLDALSYFFYSTVRQGDSNKWFIKKPNWIRRQNNSSLD